MQNGERVQLARMIFSVWFGDKSPFSAVMKRELLTPIAPPVVVVTRNMPTSSLNHPAVAHTSSSWKLLAQKQMDMLEMILFGLVVVIVALSPWIKILRRWSSSSSLSIVEEENAKRMANNKNGIRHPPNSEGENNILFAGIYSQTIAELTEEESEMLDSHGACHI